MKLVFQCYGTCGTMRPVRITRLELSNVGPFIDASIDFPEPTGNGELVLFEGPNGCGKTTILHALACIIGSDSGVGAPTPIFVRRIGDNARIRMTASDPVDGLPVERGFSGKTHRSYFVHPPKDESAGRLLDMYRAMQERVSWAAFMYQSHGPNTTLRVRGPVPDMDQVGHAHDHALSVNEASNREANLSRLLLNLMQKQLNLLGLARLDPEKAEHYESIAEATARALRRIKLALATLLERDIEFDFPDYAKQVIIKIDGRQVDGDLLGEGMRSSLSWLADLLYRLERTNWSDETLTPWDQEFWLFLDEIEASLHPTRQMRIIPAIRSLFPNARIYAATHSPFVVASAGSGTVVAIKPNRDHMVRGKIEPRALEPGQSLEWVVSQVFETPSGFIDNDTLSALAEHKADVSAIRRGEQINWPGFLSRRAWLVSLNDEVSTIVLMREVKARGVIDAEIGNRK